MISVQSIDIRATSPVSASEFYLNGNNFTVLVSCQEICDNSSDDDDDDDDGQIDCLYR